RPVRQPSARGNLLPIGLIRTCALTGALLGGNAALYETNVGRSRDPRAVQSLRCEPVRSGRVRLLFQLLAVLGPGLSKQVNRKLHGDTFECATQHLEVTFKTGTRLRRILIRRDAYRQCQFRAV